MTAWYNEIDPYVAQWLRNLIAAGHIAPGVVDERSIEDVRPIELAGYTQCHFFAGIGAWSLALRRAGWPDDRPVWTGSCPCQPFSTAGKGGGFDDERHLWPAWQWLIGERKPPVVFGEQVASKDAESWVDLVHADLEAMGYAFGCVPFPAAGIGAPHIRDRNYWVAAGVLGNTLMPRLEGQSRHGNNGNEPGRYGAEQSGPIAEAGGNGGLADTNGGESRKERRIQSEWNNGQQPSDNMVIPRIHIPRAQGQRNSERHAGPTNGFWRNADWLFCRDGKWRPVEPGTFPLAHGATARVGRLRAYGNCIVPQEAQAFIESWLEA